MRAVSLFSGAGGFELGFDRAGIHTVLQAESDKTCLDVLARHWPETERVSDVRDVREGHTATLRRRSGDMGGAEHRANPEFIRHRGEPCCGADSGVGGWAAPTGSCVHASGHLPNAGIVQRSHGAPRTEGVDLVYGGFPCQDYSVAGQRAGLEGDRGALWWEVIRILRELQPRWFIGENVPGLLSSSGGRDFASIIHSLDELGYVGAWRILDARWFGVPQRRRRVVIVAERGAANAAGPEQILALGACSSGHPAKGRQAREGVARTLSSGSHRPGVNPPGRRQEDDDNLVVDGPLLAHAGHRIDAESETLIAASLRASDGHHGHSSPRGDGADNLIAFDWQGSAGNDTSWKGQSRKHVVRSGDYAGATSATRVDAIFTPEMGVRRLTPVECEALMGWPQDHTRWAADGREITDSQRYKMCGNGVVSTVAEWVGHRLVATHNALSLEAAA